MDAEEEEDYYIAKRQKKRGLVVLGVYYFKLKRRKRKYFRQRLSLRGRKRRSRALKRHSLLDPEHSPWQKLYDSKDDAALITVTGMDHEAFTHLLDIYFPLFDNHTPWTGDHDGTTWKRLRYPHSAGRGRRRIITPAASLGLVLAWYRFRGAEFILQGWFGFTGTHNNVWLRFGRRMLYRALRKHPEARVQFPSAAEIETLKEICSARHPVLEHVYCFADGLKLTLEAASGVNIQGMYYNGWTHDHYITNLFVFSICGRIIACVVNAPGSLHDSTLATWGGVYQKLHDAFDATGGMCCVDSAFQSSNNDYLIKSAQDTTKAVTQRDFDIIRQATSLRQAAEWGMHAIQSSMPRLRDRFLYEEEEKEHREREVIMKLVPLLYNFRLEFVGLNQLRNTYVPNWSKDGDFLIHF